MSLLRQTFEGLLGELVAAPSGELGPRLVLADLLAERGHPYGELIALCAHPTLSARAVALLSEHERTFCQLVAPDALAAWVQQGLPEVAWYESRALLALGAPDYPLLRQVAVQVATGHTPRVLAHPVLRHLRALALVGNGAEDFSVATTVDLARLESLSLVGYRAAGLGGLLRRLPGLRRLSLRVGPRLLGSVVAELSAVGRALDEVRLEGVGPADHPLLAPVVAAGHARVLVREPRRGWTALAGVAPEGQDEAWWLEVEAAGAEVLARVRPDLPALEMVSQQNLSLPELTERLRLRTLRERPYFPASSIDFVDAALVVREERVAGTPLARLEPYPRPLSAPLLEAAAVAALMGSEAWPEEWWPQAVCAGPTPRLRSLWTEGCPLGFSVESVAVLCRERAAGWPLAAGWHLFGLSAMLYRALSGRWPQASTSSAPEVLKCNAEGRFVPLAQVAQVPAELNALLTHALTAAPDQRPSAVVYAHQLRRLAAQLPDDPELRASAELPAVSARAEGQLAYLDTRT